MVCENINNLLTILHKREIKEQIQSSVNEIECGQPFYI